VQEGVVGLRLALSVVAVIATDAVRTFGGAIYGG
jgi:hypothetical protein